MKGYLVLWVGVLVSCVSCSAEGSGTDAGDASVSADVVPAVDAEFSVQEARTFSDWEVVLSGWNRGSCFDYRGLLNDAAALQSLARAEALFASVDPSRLASNDERLAFWINAYNVFMVALVTRNFETMLRDTVLEPLADGPTFTTSRFRVSGANVSLDMIEHGVLRRDPSRLSGVSEEDISRLAVWAEQVYGEDEFEPRIHFAVNCASVGCPNLRSEPYYGDRIDTQLEEQTAEFLSDETKGAGSNGVSDLIFSYYPDDFVEEGGWVEFVRRYSPGANTERSLGYDWALNQCP
jgi:hypothetical protein